MKRNYFHLIISTYSDQDSDLGHRPSIKNPHCDFTAGVGYQSLFEYNRQGIQSVLTEYPWLFTLVSHVRPSPPEHLSRDIKNSGEQLKTKLTRTVYWLHYYTIFVKTGTIICYTNVSSFSARLLAIPVCPTLQCTRSLMRTVQLGSPLLVVWSSFCNYVLMASSRNLSIQIFDGGELTAAL